MIGETLSHFRVAAKLGEGGMGEVYRAEAMEAAHDGRLVMIQDLKQEGVSPSLLLVENWMAEFRQDGE